MVEPVAVEIPSSGEDDPSPFPSQIKKSKKSNATTPLLILDDDVTPSKPTPTVTPTFVPETPFSNPLHGDVSIVKCTASDSRSHSITAEKFSGLTGLICLELDNELECHPPSQSSKERETMITSFGLAEHSELNASESNSIQRIAEIDNTGSCLCGEEEVLGGSSGAWSLRQTANVIQIVGDSPTCSDRSSGDAVPQIVRDSPTCGGHSSGDAVPQVHCDNKENVPMEHEGNAVKRKGKSVGANEEKKRRRDEELARKQQLKEERKLKKEQEKVQRQALKAEAAEMRKLQKEKDKWGKGKFALKSVAAEIDAKVVEIGSIGGHLLSRFAEKGLTFHVTSNPIERSILWNLSVPEHISQLTSKGSEVPYVLLVYEAEEFCNLVMNESLMDLVCKVQSQFPSYTICFLTNKLMSYINKSFYFAGDICILQSYREQVHYKNPTSSWRRPPVEEVLSKLTTHFDRVHSRQCIDEADLAEHVVGLTCSLATCQFRTSRFWNKHDEGGREATGKEAEASNSLIAVTRKKPTCLSVNANGSLIPKDFIDKNLIKKSVWLKALIAIPKVQPRFAVAIWKKYPTMRSLLNEYMDPSKSVHEKEFLLKDLMTEGPLGREERRVGEVCSKRVYRILMAQNGNMKTDDVEDGADFFVR